MLCFYYQPLKFSYCVLIHLFPKITCLTIQYNTIQLNWIELIQYRHGFVLYSAAYTNGRGGFRWMYWTTKRLWCFWSRNKEKNNGKWSDWYSRIYCIGTYHIIIANDMMKKSHHIYVRSLIHSIPFQHFKLKNTNK